MKLSDFDYFLPEELIALYPPEDRPSARLLKVDRQNGELSHHIFREVGSFLKAGDVLVLNDTRVIPARIFGRKETGAKVEAFLLKPLGGNRWTVLLRPGRRIRKGAKLLFGENGLRVPAQVADDNRPDSCERILEFSGESFRDDLKKIGHTPLPPYIRRPDEARDRQTYQTVFAKNDGAVASPTAGLHFDDALLRQLQEKGIETLFVTLHVGYGTFQTIPVEDLERHRMFEEEFEVSETTARRINLARKEKRRVIACGTTVVRTLESCAVENGGVIPRKGSTQLFIYPPYPFKIIDGLITNFHLPKSSLLLLVAAFLGPERLRAAYAEAVEKKYNFYSYGDAMMIL